MEKLKHKKIFLTGISFLIIFLSVLGLINISLLSTGFDIVYGKDTALCIFIPYLNEQGVQCYKCDPSTGSGWGCIGCPWDECNES